ncbi:universal stress protein [Marinobacterium jannaschii]|uniref:universal stress protein n=1 Tax=Marinobacterium jannaschii TaxID=64970 RepID=UPI0004872E4C|nr:universal stress protein [Marinobacterium jannaschii]
MALPRIKTILYTTSLGKHTRPVFRQAVNMATQFNARILMLHVVEPMGEMGQALIQNYLPQDLVDKIHDEGIETIRSQMQQRVADFCAEELDSLPSEVKLDVEHLVVEGNHVDTILQQARDINADLIVMGQENTFGHHSHTTQQVTRNAEIPVLVVPTGKQYS